MQTDKKAPSLAGLTIGALGIVYGDLGTSPLYTIRECFNPHLGIPHTEANVLGILSLIFWSLVLVVIVKYTIFIMRADNNGEGGIMSLLSLVLSGRKSGKFTPTIIIIGLVGTTLLLSEGMITPSISVLSAVEGLEVATPVFRPFIIPIAIVIIVLLFAFQRHGTHRIGRVFGPIMLVWFTIIGGLGLLSILKAPGVLLALNPVFAVSFFVENGMKGTIVLGSVVLAITGAEALYADLGHFGRRPIRLAWYCLVMPALVLNYFGQGAAVLLHGEAAIRHPFYFIAPPWFLFTLILLATAAAIIASQALISGAYSMVNQVIQLGYLPKLKIIHTSHEIRGQIYIPLVNYLLMVFCIFLVLFFKNSGSLASAYGISVMGTMFCSSILYFLLMKTWNWNRAGRVFLFVLFLLIDLSFLTVNLTKIVSGGWFTLLSASVIFTIMQVWKSGSAAIFRSMQEGSLPLDMLLSSLQEDKSIVRVRGTAVFMVGNPKVRLGLLLHHLKHNRALQERVILLSILSENIPFVKPEDRLAVREHGLGFYEISARYGYMEKPTIFDVVERCNEEGIPLEAYQTSYYVGRVSLKITGGERGRTWMKLLYRFMHRNAESAMEFFELPPGCVIELGTQIEM